MKKRELMNRTFGLISFTLCYLLTCIVYYFNNILAGVILVVYSIIQYIVNVKKTGSLVDLRSIFLLTWCSTLGLAMFRILFYQTTIYSMRFLAIQYIGIFTLLIAIDIGKMLTKSTFHSAYNYRERIFDKKVYYAVLLCSFVAIFCYIMNYRIVGFIPLFENSNNAYILNSSKFMTIEVGMAPVAGLAYYCSTMVDIKKRQKIIMWICMMMNMIIFPVLNLSRGNLLANICMFLPAFVYCTPDIKKTVKRLTFVVLMFFLLLTSKRDFTAAYSSLTNSGANDDRLWILMLYSNITCSHDNFALNVDTFENFTNGLRMFNIFNEILDIEKIQNILRNSTTRLVSPVINTHDMFGFFYYDMGVFGVILWSLVWGVLWGITEKKYMENPNPISCIVFGISFYCVAFAFFSSKTGFVVAMWYGMTMICYLLMFIKARPGI